MAWAQWVLLVVLVTVISLWSIGGWRMDRPVTRAQWAVFWCGLALFSAVLTLCILAGSFSHIFGWPN